MGKSDVLPAGSEEPAGVRHHGRMEDELEVLRRQIDAKVRRLAAEHELDEALVSDVLRAVIDRVVAEHRELAPER